MLEEATDWFIRLRDPSRTPADERAFQAWIARSQSHGDAWRKICRTWNVMGEMALLADDRQKPTAPVPASSQPRRAAWKGAAVMAMAACLLLLAIFPTVLVGSGADFRTQTGELKTVTLEDGSSVELGASSAIDTDFSNGKREVRLLAGEAFFNVRPDPARPFLVSAEGIEITVVGTVFDVRLRGQSTDVDLLHGAVRLAIAGDGQSYLLAPGESVSVGRDDRTVTRSRMAPEDMAAWRTGRLFVENVTIASVVDEIRRYHPSWITLASSDLASRRVTGLYDLSDPDRALEALVTPFGGKVHHVSPYMRVIAAF